MVLQAFGAPAKLSELVSGVNTAMTDRLPPTVAKTRLYLPNPATRAILFRPIKSNIAEAHGQIAQLLEAEYSPEEAAQVCGSFRSFLDVCLPLFPAPSLSLSLSLWFSPPPALPATLLRHMAIHHSCWRRSTAQRKPCRCVGFSGCRPRFCGLVHSLCFPLSLSSFPLPLATHLVLFSSAVS